MITTPAIKRFILTIVSMTLGASTLTLAQSPGTTTAAPASDWSGWYVGVHAGQANANYDGIYDSSDLDEIPADSHIPASLLDDSGFAGGVHAGWNHQRGSFVCGIEGDVSSISIDKSALEPEDGSEKTTTQTDWLVSLRARAGVAVHRVMIFGSVGLAYVKGDYSVEDPGDGNGGVDFNQAGPIAGAGIEWAAWDKVSLRAEGLYYFFGDKVDTSRLTADSDPDDFIELENAYEIRVGATLRF